MQRICCRQFLLHTLVSAKPATRSFFRTNVSLQKGCRKGAAHFYLCGPLFHRHYFIKSNP